MNSSTLLNPPTGEQLTLIYKELNIDDNKIENNVRLLIEWLRCENYLPSNVDEKLLNYFLLGCKGNLEKTKEKLEKYFTAKTKLNYLFEHTNTIDQDYILYPMQRCIFISTKYTKQGNRLVIFTLPTPDTKYFDSIKISKYVILTLEFLMYHDITAGFDFIYNATNVSGQILSKLNLTTAKHIFDLLYNILPIRTRSIFILNPNPVFEIIMRLARSLMPKKLQDRISNGKLEDLVNYYPNDCLPVEYGGTESSTNALCDEYLSLFKRNREWIKQIGKVKLRGPLPEHKQRLYSFEEFIMDGSFRKLDID